jgi:hypothetical protein
LQHLPASSQLFPDAEAVALASFFTSPPQPSQDVIGPDRLALANCMLGAVNALLHTKAERRRAPWWGAVEEQQTASAAHGLN